MTKNIRITRGVVKDKAVKVVVYGPEGIGKSTFASHFPQPLFIDTEGSTDLLDVMRFPRPEKWDEIIAEVEAVRQNPNVCKTLVIDTGDWAERLCEMYVCQKNGKEGIEDFGYGKGYTYVKEVFGHLLDKLTKVNELGVNVVITAHSIIRKFELPDETGQFDRYELKLGNKAGSQCAALVKEWADMVLFANYKVIVTEVNGKNKAQGGRRVMYTQHAPTWDAKNRYGLKDELPFDYQEIAQFIPSSPNAKPVKESKETTAQNAPAATEATPAPKTTKNTKEPPKAAQNAAPAKTAEKPTVYQLIEARAKESGVTLNDIEQFIMRNGVLSKPTKVKDMPPGLIGDILKQWDEVVEDIHQEDMQIPF